MFGGADCISARRVHDDDALPRGGVDVHVIDACAGATHDLQPRTSVNDVLNGIYGIWP